MNLNFSELTSHELDGMLATLDALYQLDTLIDERHVVQDESDIMLDALANAIDEELERRSLEDAGYKVNQMVGRGEVDRYVRPDGEIGYAPPAAWDELGANKDANFDL